MKKEYKQKRIPRFIIIISIKFDISKIVSEICIATLIFGNVQITNPKVDSSQFENLDKQAKIVELTKDYYHIN
jgi:hypothetical protein